MPSYKAPLQDMQFILNEVINIQEVLDLPYFEPIDKDILNPVLEEAAKICENEIAPLNQSGDAEGCAFIAGQVKTPKGFKEAYRHFIDGGWMSLCAEPAHGGQGLPKTLQIFIDEMLASANVSFSLYTVLTQGAVQALQTYGSETLKNLYLPKLVSGEWGGTMCLTESHCGTDLGLLRTKAEPQADGAYKISGTKIFITSGEHDLTDNIIHMVLARLPDAPPGVKGISMFLVPKFLLNPDGSPGAQNAVVCGSIEHKMGIKASATCVMNFDNATGYLLGEAHQGMRAMFSMMNLERINIGLEGLGLSEVAYQNALIYAKERLQSRAPTGAKYPDKAADPIIVHPDVRRMLLTMKAYNEGCRALAAWTGKWVDISKHHPDTEMQKQAESFVALITPVIKAFFTDQGFENCNLGLQIYGGHGYIREWGMEQFVRDARIAQIYEGTNGIQALDLVRRKLIGNDGESLNELTKHISEFITMYKDVREISELLQSFEEKLTILVDTSFWLMQQAKADPNIIGASSVDYLRMLALILVGFMWLHIAAAACKKQEQQDFYKAKMLSARFYFRRLMPQINSLQQSIMAGSEILMDLDERLF